MDAAQEIATLKQQLMQTQLAYQEALQLSHFKGAFLARTSHELRAPLSSLMGLHQLILSDLCESPEEERDFIQQAHQASQRLLALLDKIVYVSKLEHGSNKLNLECLSLQALLNEVKTLTQLQAQNRGYPVEILAADVSLMIQGDQKRLIQTLVGLMDAAIDHMKAGSLHLGHAATPQQMVLTLTVQSPHVIWSADLSTDTTMPTVELASTNPDQAQMSDAQTNVASPELAWMLAEGVLQQMGGQLCLISTPTPDNDCTTVEILLPLGSAPE
ncbi:MAG: HAMP domain-containing sensor histidine kinase [Cyanobacteria bacterium P01_G01_bin.54]